jgi:hypothetical protein
MSIMHDDLIPSQFLFIIAVRPASGGFCPAACRIEPQADVLPKLGVYHRAPLT